MSADLPAPVPRAEVLGSRINLCGLPGALTEVERSIDAGTGGYVCFANAHTVIEGRRDASFRAITNQSLLSLADGKPVYWVTRWRTRGRAGHAPGPDFFAHALLQRPQRRHFLYGSTPENLEVLRARIAADYPGAVICGAFSPPFRPLTDADRAEHVRMIRESGAEYVWVGLGAPKQERWMAEMAPSLRPAVLFGVGAAFDFHSGRVRRAPALMRRFGLEWLYRLGQEPRRLWRRYLVTNSLFLWHLATDRGSRADRDAR